MKTFRIKLSLSLSLLILSIYSASAQSLKEPSPAEKKMLAVPIRIIQSILDQFGNNDWKLDQDWYNDDPMVPVSDDGTGAIGINQNFERIYMVREGSKRFNTLLKPLTDRMDVLTNKVSGEMQEISKKSIKEQEAFMQDNPTSDSLNNISNQLNNLNEVDVYAYIDCGYIEGRPFNDPDINLRGADMVTKMDKGYFSSEFKNTYFLAFGNWKNIKLDTKFNYYYYKFKNTKTPSIQNIVIVLTGAPDRMKELMNKIDWSVLNNALTK